MNAHGPTINFMRLIRILINLHLTSPNEDEETPKTKKSMRVNKIQLNRPNQQKQLRRHNL